MDIREIKERISEHPLTHKDGKKTYKLPHQPYGEFLIKCKKQNRIPELWLYWDISRCLYIYNIPNTIKGRNDAMTHGYEVIWLKVNTPMAKWKKRLFEFEDGSFIIEDC